MTTFGVTEAPAARSGGSSTAAHSSAAPSSLVLAPASSGDHLVIHNFLLGVCQAPSASEFQSQLEDPRYEPMDRLVVRHNQRIVGHVRQLQRELYFDGINVPAGGLCDLVIAPEYRRRGFGAQLVFAAERELIRGGALLGFTRTVAPQLFARRGWVTWGRHCYSKARTRDVLAELSQRERTPSAPVDALHPPLPASPLSTRIWRHVERAALVRLFAQNMQGVCGGTVRSDEQWAWLVSRRAYDSIYVAVSGKDKWDLDERPLVGYAIVKDSRIVELMAAPNRPDAGAQLLRRVCGDFIERDMHHVRLDGPPNSPWHRVMVRSGGELVERDVDSQQTLMAKLFNPLGWLQRLRPLLAERARRAGLDRLTLQLRVAGAAYRVTIAGDTVEVANDSVVDAGLNHVVEMSGDMFARLTLGELQLSQASDVKRVMGREPSGSASALVSGDACEGAAEREGAQIRGSSREALAIADALFPRRTFWRPPFDELAAQ